MLVYIRESLERFKVLKENKKVTRRWVGDGWGRI